MVSGDWGISGLHVCLCFLSQKQQQPFKQTGSSLIQSIKKFI